MAEGFPAFPVASWSTTQSLLGAFADAVANQATMIGTRAGETRTSVAIPESVWRGAAGDSVRELGHDVVQNLEHVDNPVNKIADAIRDLQRTLAPWAQRVGELRVEYATLARGDAANQVRARDIVAQARRYSSKAEGEIADAVQRIIELTDRLRDRRKALNDLQDTLQGRKEGAPVELDQYARKQGAALSRVAHRADFSPYYGLLGAAGVRDLVADRIASDQTLINTGGGQAVTLRMVEQFRRLYNHWSELDVQTRVERLKDLLGDAMAANGFDPVDVGFGVMKPGVGAYYTNGLGDHGTIVLDQSTIRSNVLGPDDAASLFAILVHEGTHAIEWARLNIDGKGAPDIKTVTPDDSSAWRDTKVAGLVEMQQHQLASSAEMSTLNTEGFPTLNTPRAKTIYYCSPIEWESYREDAAAESLYRLLVLDQTPTVGMVKLSLPPFECRAEPEYPTTVSAALPQTEATSGLLP